MFRTGRTSGVLLPLFSLRSVDDFGIGDFGAVDGFFAWMNRARQRLWMLLPLLPTAPDDPSPYSTRSAFGLNPLFIDLASLEDFQALGGEAIFTEPEREQLHQARSAKQIRYDLVFRLKHKALRQAFEHFEATHHGRQTTRAVAFERFRDTESDWLEPFTLFSALSRENAHKPFWDWPAELASRQSDAIAKAAIRLSKEIRFGAWKQWVADTQWQIVRRKARAAGVLLCGDEPFVVGRDSSDVWSHPHLLRRDARLGVPPDDFSATGQDWGLPYFDFEAMAKDNDGWIRWRAEKSAAYFDLRRIDHAVGYFRQWIRDAHNPYGRFLPDNEPAQRARGEHNFRLFAETGAGVVAEDLGVIPDWVRHTLSALELPGYRVLRWERDGLHYRNPQHFPKVSLVTTGTHDTETLAQWWEGASHEERAAQTQAYPSLTLLGAPGQFTPQVHHAQLEAALGAQSDLCVLPWQDVLGTRERINLPGTQSDANWSYRQPQPSSQLLLNTETLSAAERLAELTIQNHRDKHQRG
ncbi:MAG: 4-alpha-glucanotransferase [Myxococcaceae bacterium]